MCKKCKEKDEKIKRLEKTVFNRDAAIDRLKTAIYPQRLLFAEVRKESYRLNGLLHFGSIKDVY